MVRCFPCSRGDRSYWWADYSGAVVRAAVLDYAASQSLLASRIDWIWFMSSQIAFGAVAGIVVVPTGANLNSRESAFLCVRGSKLRG